MYNHKNSLDTERNSIAEMNISQNRNSVPFIICYIKRANRMVLNKSTQLQVEQIRRKIHQSVIKHLFNTSYCISPSQRLISLLWRSSPLRFLMVKEHCISMSLRMQNTTHLRMTLQTATDFLSLALYKNRGITKNAIKFTALLLSTITI